MTKKLSKVSAALISLALCLCLVLILSGCGNKKTENQADQTQSKDNQENVSKENNPYSFIPKFEEQVIYDKDGIKLTAIGIAEGENPKDFFNYIMYCKIENKRKEKIELLPTGIETKDGFRLTTTTPNLMSEIEPGQEATDCIVFDCTVSFGNKSGDDTLFQEYGLSSVLGDFRLNFVVMDSKTYNHIITDSSDYIKTEKGDVSYDYSEVLNKQPIVDQDGVKISVLDHFILPPDEKSYDNISYYCLLFYYENQNEEDCYLDFITSLIDGKKFDIVRPSWNYGAKSKGFDIIKLNVDALKEEGFESFKALDFSLKASKMVDEEKRRFEETFRKENLHLDLSENWKIREITE